MRMIGVFIILILASLQYKLWFSDSSILKLERLHKKLSTQLNENNSLSARNKAIEADISELKSGDQALEEQARFDLGMVQQGEIYYQFVD